MTRPFLLGTTLGIALGLLISWYRGLADHYHRTATALLAAHPESWRDVRLDELADRIEPARLEGRGWKH